MDDPKSTKQLVQKLSAPLVSMMSSAHGQSPRFSTSLCVTRVDCSETQGFDERCEDFSVRTTIRSTSRWKSWRFLTNLPRSVTSSKFFGTQGGNNFTRLQSEFGRCAITSQLRDVSTCSELIKTKVTASYRKLRIIKDVFRKYPNHYESIIPIPDLSHGARIESRTIWIIGEYAEKIDNADESLQFFIDSFKDEDIGNFNS